MCVDEKRSRKEGGDEGVYATEKARERERESVSIE